MNHRLLKRQIDALKNLEVIAVKQEEIVGTSCSVSLNKADVLLNYMKEAIRKSAQIILGVWIFDFPGLNKLRNLLIGALSTSFGRKNVISAKVMLYVPHGLNKAPVNIGNRVRISENVRIDCSAPIQLGDNVWISENVCIFNHIHRIEGAKWKESKNVALTSGLTVGEDAWIGAGAYILPKVSCIGKGAIIGAGSVVTKNVDDYSVVAGNPARVIGSRMKDDGSDQC